MQPSLSPEGHSRTRCEFSRKNFMLEKPSSAPPAEKAAKLSAELKAARTAWHESYGVPVSAEYAGFMEAIGNLTDFVDQNRSICKAERSGVGGNDPQDCDWPFCGCDPKADKVIEAIEESGFKIVKNGGTLQSLRDAINLIHSEANRSERGGDDGTAAHWRDVAAILSGNLLSETVRVERAIEESQGQRWIPVEEKLPELNAYVWFWVPSLGARGNWETGYFRVSAFECERTGPRDEFIVYEDHQVSHWMLAALPDPPKGNENV